MTNSPKISKQKLKIFAIAGAILLLYFAGTIKTITSGFGVTFNPIKIISCILKYGFPLKELMLLLAIAAVFLISIVLKIQREGGEMDILGRRFKLAKDRQVYGDVHFESPKEFKDIAFVQPIDDAMGTILGQMDDKGKEIINTNMRNTRDNNHMMVVGASGSGKSFTFTKPFCYQCVKRRESVVITDPDGGLFRDLAGYFQDNGYVVRHFDLNVLKKSDGWDCLNSIQGDDVEIMAQMFANTIMSNLVSDVGSIYGSGPMSLLKACILRVALDDGSSFPPEMKNIESVYGMLQNPRGEEYLDEMFYPDSMPPGTEPALGPYLAFKQGSPNLRGNLVTNLAVQLQLLQNKLVCQVLSTDDIDMTLPAQQPCAYFCGFPDSHDTYKFIVSLFFSMLFIKLIGYADRQPSGRCPVPVNFLLDEFAAIGKIPDFDRKIATVRKRSMNIIMIFQDLTQLQNLYEKSWVTLMENCATFISLGINDQETAGFMNKRIGETTVEVKTVQHDAIESIFRVYNRNSTGEGKRALLSFDELFRIDRDSCVILHSGHNPIFAHKYPHTLHPAAKKLRPINISDIPDITDTEARAERREQERAFVEDYLKRHPLEEVDRTYASMVEPEPEYTIADGIKKLLASTLENFVTPANRSLHASKQKKPDKETESPVEFIFEETLDIGEAHEKTDTADANEAGPDPEEVKDADLTGEEEVAIDKTEPAEPPSFEDVKTDTPQSADIPQELSQGPSLMPTEAKTSTSPQKSATDDFPFAISQHQDERTPAPAPPGVAADRKKAPAPSPAPAPAFVNRDSKRTPQKKVDLDLDPGAAIAQTFNHQDNSRKVSKDIVSVDDRRKPKPKEGVQPVNSPPPKKNKVQPQQMPPARAPQF